MRLEPGARHTWEMRLPPPPGPGTFPLTVRVRYLDAAGLSGAVPLVALVSTPGEGPSAVRATLEVLPIAHTGHGTLRLENPERSPIAGRVVFVLPGGLGTEPESLPAQVAAGGETRVPLVVENAGELPAGRYPAYATFEHDEGGVHRTVVAPVLLDVVTRSGYERARRLAVGLGALAAALLVLALAWRAARR